MTLAQHHASIGPTSRDYHIDTLALKALKYCFHFEIIINVLVSAVRFIWICYGHKAIINFFTLSVLGATVDVRIGRPQTSDSGAMYTLEGSGAMLTQKYCVF